MKLIVLILILCLTTLISFCEAIPANKSGLVYYQVPAKTANYAIVTTEDLRVIEAARLELEYLRKNSFNQRKLGIFGGYATNNSLFGGFIYMF